MFQPGKWAFDPFRFVGFALIVGGFLLNLYRVQAGEPIGGDGFALIAVGLFFRVASQRIKERGNEPDH